jgi:hypothetical protein
MSGIWKDVSPLQLRGSERKHPWLFAHYLEAPSERDDGCWYQAFLFRDSERRLFGISERVERRLTRLDVRQLATKIIQDEAFRSTLLSEDQRLRDIWKRR